MLFEILAAVVALAAIAALLVMLRQASTLQRLRLLAEQKPGRNAQRSRDHTCRPVA